MKKLMLLTVLAAILAGCKSKEFKSTPLYEGTDIKYVGDAHDRVNLWPIAYWHNPVGSIAWPVVSFSDDLFALRPVYSQYKQNGAKGEYDEFNFLWPIAQADTKHNDYRIFPVFWGESCKRGEYYQTIFPLYFNGPEYNVLFPIWGYRANNEKWTFATLAGLAGAKHGSDYDNKYRASWCFPLWYENSEGILATTLFGYGKDSAWVFPIGYWDNDSFFSIPYSHGRRGGSANNTWWAVPLTLSWGETYKNEKSASVNVDGRLLLGFCGWDWYDWEKDSYRHEWWFGPLMGYEGHRSWSETWFLLRLAAYSTKDGKADESYFFPLYWWERNSGFMTPLGGWDCYTYYITPLIGINRAESNVSGGYVFPLWFHEKSRDFEAKVAMMDADKLPDSIEVYEETRTNTVGKVETRLNARTEKNFAHDRTTWFLLSDHDREVWITGCNLYGSEKQTCDMTSSHKFGNRLLLNSEGHRTVEYDLATREKISDKENEEASFLCFFYQSESSNDRFEGKTYSRQRVLWKLWDYEDRNGKVTLDVFPGFTYDKDKEGNSHTSFLWRFYRYESKSDGGTNLDLLFIPILRAK